jgi:Protein of unknown function (DUF2950)
MVARRNGQPEDLMKSLSNRFETHRTKRLKRNAMLHKNSIVVKKGVVRFAASILFAPLLGSWLAPTFAQQPGQPTFASPEDAGRALSGAMQEQDDQLASSISGPAGKDVLSSGDPAEDANARIRFLVK